MLSKEKIDEIFAVDQCGRFLNLVIPANGHKKELNLVGKKQLDLSLDEVVRLKKYAQELYEELLK